MVALTKQQLNYSIRRKKMKKSSVRQLWCAHAITIAAFAIAMFDWELGSIVTAWLVGSEFVIAKVLKI